MKIKLSAKLIGTLGVGVVVAGLILAQTSTPRTTSRMIHQIKVFTADHPPMSGKDPQESLLCGCQELEEVAVVQDVAMIRGVTAIEGPVMAAEVGNPRIDSRLQSRPTSQSPLELVAVVEVAPKEKTVETLALDHFSP